MTLRQKQSKFVHMIAMLILHAEHLGYELTWGETWRLPRAGSHPTSLHYDRLAADLNLFKDGKWLKTTKAHTPLGEYWESIGGTWGGRFNDGNHYSLEHGGMK